jgi:hypothetical protein
MNVICTSLEAVGALRKKGAAQRSKEGGANAV